MNPTLNAIVYKKKEVEGLTSVNIDGDMHDLRFLDKKGGYVVALSAKGDAKKDKTGFVI